ncbi:MAG: T9SS type A sorting domain-containing protein [Chitinophagales bacterium]
MKTLIVIVASFFNISIFAQPVVEWDKTLGGNSHQQLRNAIQLPNGTYTMGGWSNSGISGDKTVPHKGDLDFWVINVNSLGGILWQKSYGGLGWDDLNQINITSDGGYILGGTSNSDISGDKTDTSKGGLDYWILKTDSTGNIQWQKTYGGNADERLYSISQTIDGGYIVNGWSESGISGDKTESSKGGIDLWILKLDISGNIQWQKTIGGTGNESFYQILHSDKGDTLGGAPIIQTSDAGYLLGCSSNSDISGDKTENSKGEFDYWVIKLDNNGNIQWQKTIGGAQSDRIHAIEESSNNGEYIIAGSSKSGISGDKTEAHIGQFDYWVVKLDISGNIQWQKTIGGSDFDALTTVNECDNSDVLIGGKSRSPVSGSKTMNTKGSNDYWLVKLDTSGNIVWQSVIGGNSWDNLSSVSLTNDGGYFLAGTSQSLISGDKSEAKRGLRDYWVVKLSPDTGVVAQDLVWPGDANDDGVANVYDILPIAVGYNTAGLVRANASSNWVGQASSDWADTFSIGVNYKHADCDGNGIIDLFDVQPIGMNYGLTHAKSSGSPQQALNPDLFLNFQKDSFQLGETVQGTIQLGTMSNPIDDIYGIAFSIAYDASIIDSNSFQVDFSNSWLAPIDSSVFLYKDIYSASKVDMGIARIDHNNKTGYGALAIVSFVLQDNIDGKNDLAATLNLNFDNVVAIAADESELNISSAGDSLFVQNKSVGIAPNFEGQFGLEVYPNPTRGQLIVEWHENNDLETIKLFDSTGKIISQNNISGELKTTLDTQNLPAGIYLLEIAGKNSRSMRKVSVLK